LSVVRPASVLRFVYPFTFAREALAEHALAADRAEWSSNGRALKLWRPQRFSVEDLLRHVAAYLNPPGDRPPTARLWRLEQSALSAAAGLGGGLEHPLATWTLKARRKHIPFLIAGVELAMFRDGVGVLCISARPVSDALGDWLDFLHHFRFIAGQREVGISADRAPSDQTGGQGDKVAFFPEPAGGLKEHPDGKGCLGDLLAGLLASAAIAPANGPWWDEVFVPGMLLPFGSLFVDDVGPDAVPTLLYRMRNFYHSDQEIHPNAADLAPDHASLLPYAEQQWFFFSLNGGGFLACNPPDTQFFKNTLPGHLSEHYYLLFLLAVEQRFMLTMLSQEVAENWVGNDTADYESRAAAFTRIRDALLAFTAQGYFPQVMQQEHHHRCYVEWEKTFQIDWLHQEVSSMVREMHSVLDMRQRERLEKRAKAVDRRISLLSWVLAFPGLLFMVFANIQNAGLLAQPCPSSPRWRQSLPTCARSWWVAALSPPRFGTPVCCAIRPWMRSSPASSASVSKRSSVMASSSSAGWMAVMTWSSTSA
jgi:hypothetical protein